MSVFHFIFIYFHDKVEHMWHRMHFQARNPNS